MFKKFLSAYMVGLRQKTISRYCSFKGATDKGTLLSASVGTAASTGSEM
jgi:hypothetical protein